ncbi:hypothetical protein CBR_g49562 [Chara braunii]|uniref:Uncharacterized protein n=1 Tax=Chara braunii TaxID=69332 RepID=A0A388M5E4_CHABU|nr:hypothetical protein CBR_g49562 [Chara braunii]|eukprot:GBG89709.1 hypothetical protein CBR_g49562 [Chara braunii]
MLGRHLRNQLEYRYGLLAGEADCGEDDDNNNNGDTHLQWGDGNRADEWKVEHEVKTEVVVVVEGMQGMGEIDKKGAKVDDDNNNNDNNSSNGGEQRQGEMADTGVKNDDNNNNDTNNNNACEQGLGEIGGDGTRDDNNSNNDGDNNNNDNDNNNDNYKVATTTAGELKTTMTTALGKLGGTSSLVGLVRCDLRLKCRTRMRDMERQANQANQASSSNAASAPILPAPGAIIPYQAPSNDVRHYQGTGGYNGGSNSGYNSGGYNNSYRRSWNSGQSYQGDKVERMWNWMSEELAERERTKREKDEATKKENEAKQQKEAEEMKLADKREKEEFKASIGLMVHNQMKQVCEEVLGKKMGDGDLMISKTVDEIRRRAEAEKPNDKDMDACRKKDEEIFRLKCSMAELQRKTDQTID